MKKTLVMAFGLICCSNIFAAQASIVCPATLTCNYAAGTCDLPSAKWSLYVSYDVRPFTTLNLGRIMGSTYTRTHVSTLECSYNVNEGQVSISIPVQKFQGANWTFSGFGNGNATCPSNADPANCAAE